MGGIFCRTGTVLAAGPQPGAEPGGRALAKRAPCIRGRKRHAAVRKGALGNHARARPLIGGKRNSYYGVPEPGTTGSRGRAGICIRGRPAQTARGDRGAYAAPGPGATLISGFAFQNLFQFRQFDLYFFRSGVKSGIVQYRRLKKSMRNVAPSPFGITRPGTLQNAWGLSKGGPVPHAACSTASATALCPAVSGCRSSQRRRVLPIPIDDHLRPVFEAAEEFAHSGLTRISMDFVIERLTFGG